MESKLAQVSRKKRQQQSQTSWKKNIPRVERTLVTMGREVFREMKSLNPNKSTEKGHVRLQTFVVNFSLLCALFLCVYQLFFYFQKDTYLFNIFQIMPHLPSLLGLAPQSYTRAHLYFLSSCLAFSLLISILRNRDTRIDAQKCSK